MKRTIDADNSCLFNSIGYCLLDSRKEQKTMRKVVRDTIKKKQKEFEVMLDREFHEYLEWIMKSTSWGGAIEIMILSKYYKTELCVVNIQSLTHIIYGQESFYDKRIYLLYDGLHYDAIVRNIYEDASEDTDEKVFITSDKYALEGALVFVNGLRKLRQFTDLTKCELVCTDCYLGLKNTKEASAHAEETKHVNFEEASIFQK